MVTHITRTTVDSVNWTAIVAPYDCDFLAFYAEGQTDVLVRSNSSDPTTEKRLNAGIQETLATPMSRHRRTARFFIGDTVYFVKKASGGTDVIVSTWSGMAD